jgi:hypothetical protein
MDPNSSFFMKAPAMALNVSRALIAAALLAIFGSGCAGLQEKQRLEDFDLTSKAYAKAIFWSQFEIAHAFHARSRSAADLPDFQRLRKYKVVAYNIAGFFPSEDKRRIHQVVEIRYFRTDTLVVKSIQSRQAWIYDDEDGRWLLEGRLPDFE